MSQQINLLAPRARHDRYLLQVACVLGATVLSLAGWWGVLFYETWQIQMQLNALVPQIAKLQAGRTQANHTTPESEQLKSEIEALNPQAVAIKPFLDEVRRGGLGRPEGFSRWLHQLASVPHPESWLNQIELRHRGVQMTLNGLALNDAAIARYAAEVNRHFTDQGVQLQSLELTRPSAEASIASGERAAAPSSITFKMY